MRGENAEIIREENFRRELARKAFLKAGGDSQLFDYWYNDSTAQKDWLAEKKISAQYRL